MLRAPLTLVVEGHRGLVGLGSAEHPTEDDYRSEIGLLVQDGEQGLGIGTALALRLGSTLHSLGYAQVLTRSATATVPLHRVLQKLGPVRTLERSPATVLTARLNPPDRPAARRRPHPGLSEDGWRTEDGTVFSRPARRQ